MEISCRLKFNPSLPLNPLCFRQEFRRSSSLSFNPLCANRGLNVRCSPFKHFNGKSSKKYDLPAIHLQSRSKHVSTSASASWRVFNRNADSNQLCHYYKWHKQSKLLRYVVARSDIAGTGCSDAAHQLSEISSAEIGLGSKVRGGCFYVVTASLSIFLFILMMVAHPFVLLFDRHRRKFHHFVAKVWALFTVSPFLKVEVVGLDNLPAQDTPAVYVSNHQSFLDTYVLLTLGRSFKFISKTSIFLYPIIGWAMFLMGAIPLKRMDSRSQLQTLKRCMDLLKNGGSVFFFPEGTRSKDGNLGVFKKGAFSVAAKCRVPIVPITLIGTGKIMPSGMEGILNPGSVKVFIHKAIDGNNADILCNEVRNIIADTLIHQG